LSESSRVENLENFHPYGAFPLPIIYLTYLRTQDLGEEYRQGTAALADMDSSAPVPREAYKKLDSGVIIADLIKGNGPTVEAGSKVNLEWVLRKSNGYFVDSSQVVGQPFIFTVGGGGAIQGVDEGIRGMKQGGVRRLLIPPSLAYVGEWSSGVELKTSRWVVRTLMLVGLV
jgi:FKBP-type peptidyl-prolyl cis-trans isomerase